MKSKITVLNREKLLRNLEEYKTSTNYVLTKSIVVFEDKKDIIQSGATEYQGFSDSLAF